MNRNNNRDRITKVDLLKDLQVNREINNWGGLLVIRAIGFSEHGHAGIPVLVRADNKTDSLTDGILEFNFMIQKLENRPCKKVEWDLAVVYQMDSLPNGIKAIKVNAAQNADIALLLN